VKTADEVRLIEASQRAVFDAMRLAEHALRASRIKRGKLFLRGQVLTSERLRTMINVHLLEKDFIASDTIVACGQRSIDPHDQGSGPLKPHASIIVDIFPRSMKTLYYGDATRTFCKGRAPEGLGKLYATVKKGQELALRMIKAGVNGHGVHKSILALFEKQGYITGEKGGRMQGFFHSTGHGIGIELHENPTRIGPVDYTLKAGNVVSVEPGLYYKGIGGVRIEDLAHVTKRGCTVLAGYPKRLEIR
jgi:Xaa-Pro aminopeptidase